MTKLVLSELLDSVGINKSILAKLLDVSRQTIHRMGDDVSDDVLAVIDKYKADMTHEQSESVPVADTMPVKQVIHDDGYHVKEYDSGRLNRITHRNIALSCQAHGTGGIDKATLAKSFNLSVFDYNQAVQDTVIHCQDNDTSFKELRQ